MTSSPSQQPYVFTEALSYCAGISFNFCENATKRVETIKAENTINFHHLLGRLEQA